MHLSLDEKVAGVLAPVFALRREGDLGIGDTQGVKEFIDWAAAVGFRLAKFLPINETGGDHSPYNALSARALDPTTLHLTPEVMPDLREDEYAAALAAVEGGALGGSSVNYAVVKPLKQHLLQLAFARFRRYQMARNTARYRAFLAFVEAEREWLPDYVLFRALIEENGGDECWRRWPLAQQSAPAARGWFGALTGPAAEKFSRRMNFFRYVQWLSDTQWREVKAHAERAGVALMGDIPFGVSPNSAEVWAQPHMFRAGWCGGTPPDKIFKHDPFVQKWGQNWGIPLYDWEEMRRDHFRWWRARVGGVRRFFDLFRIDHILGFYRIYGFPWPPEENATFLPLDLAEASARNAGRLPGFQPRPDDTPENRERNRLEGEEYLRAILAEAGPGRVVGEDLGEVPDYVRPSLTALGIAGYKVPQWEKQADGAWISGGDYPRLSLATYGTHDHEPLRAQWERLVSEAPADPGSAGELRRWCEYAGLPDPPPADFGAVHLPLLAALLRSNAWLAVVMISDVLGQAERFNFPGVASLANWSQRLPVPLAQLSQQPAVGELSGLIRRFRGGNRA